MIVGRTEEQGRVRALLARAAGGASGAVLLVGDPGIGKSALLDDTVAQARGWTVLRTSGVETEAELAFAGLGDLLRPLVDRVQALDEAQAEALLGALALRAEPANPLAVRVALLQLLAGVAEDGPVLVVVDDAQWVDRPSLELLGFALRRLTVEPVATILATRDARVPGIALGPDDVLALGPLDERAARDLVSGRDGRPAPDALLDAAGGNPLALLELPRSPAPGSGPVAPLAPGPRLVAAYQERLDHLPEEVRVALGVVAAAGNGDAGVVRAALDGLDLPRTVLDGVERDGLVVSGPGRVGLRHPLLRSVAYHALDPPEQRRVHAALAGALVDPSQRDRRAWHRAGATDGVDEAVAAELEAVARDATRRGAPATAAAGLARAAALTPIGEDRARRHLAAGEEWWVAKRWAEAVEHLHLARTTTTDPLLLADIDLVWGQTESYRSGPAAGAAALVDAADRVAPVDAARATVLLAHATNAAALAGDARLATDLSGRADRLAATAPGAAAVAAAMARAQAALLAGDDVAARDAVEPLAVLADQLVDADLPEVDQLQALVLFADTVREDWAAGRRRATLIVGRARRTGRVALLPFALAAGSEIDWRAGRWSDAYASVTSDDWGSPADAPVVGAWLQAVQARIEAGLGLDDDARGHAEAALVATGHQPGAANAWAEASLGFLDLGRDRPDAAITHLTAVATQMADGGVGDPAIVWWAGDLIEALWRTGRLGEARRRAEALRNQATATPRVWARAIADRSDGLLGTDAGAVEASFAAALATHDERPMPFERARTLLLLAERRRQLGSADHRDPAREALGVFDRLGAVPWTERALRVLGDQRSTPAVTPLTKQERQVAAVVGRGATNREAAAELFLSPKTVDFHLRNIYRKLGLRSRTELARRLAEEGSGDRRRRRTDQPVDVEAPPSPSAGLRPRRGGGPW